MGITYCSYLYFTLMKLKSVGNMTELSAVVFDDDEFSCIVFARILKAKKVNVTSYSNHGLYICKQPGIETCPVTAPCTDFLLTENLTPGMTGLEFLKWLKQIDCKIPDCRKAIISANWVAEDLKEAKQFMSNVFHKSESNEKISTWVENTPKS